MFQVGLTITCYEWPRPAQRLESSLTDL